MGLRAFDRVAYQLVYFELMILGCTVHCRFRFSDCTVIHCVDYLGIRTDGHGFVEKKEVDLIGAIVYNRAKVHMHQKFLNP